MSRDMTDSWHDKPVDEIAARFATDTLHGLSTREAAERLAQNGSNELRKGEAISSLAILAGQFRSLVIRVLIAAALVIANGATQSPELPPCCGISLRVRLLCRRSLS
jgi:magnesium-transporting ATPase (P-type)